MIKIIESSGKDFVIWDYLSLACITLIGATEMTPQLKQSVMNIVGILVDGNLEAKKETVKNGILPFKS